MRTMQGKLITIYNARCFTPIHSIRSYLTGAIFKNIYLNYMGTRVGPPGLEPTTFSISVDYYATSSPLTQKNPLEKEPGKYEF